MEVIDPASEDQVAILAQFTSLLSMVIFLVLNGHHWFIRTLVESYQWVPPFGFRVNGPVLERLMRLTAEMSVIGLKAGAPVMVAVLLGTVAFALVARAVPQMNIFVVSMPLNIGLGLVFFGLSLPHLAGYLGQLSALIQSRMDDWASTITREVGAPFGFAQMGQVFASTMIIKIVSNRYNFPRAFRLSVIWLRWDRRRTGTDVCTSHSASCMLRLP